MKLYYWISLICLQSMLLLMPADVTAGTEKYLFTRNPSRALLATAAEDLRNGTYSGKYNITPDSFLNLLASCADLEKSQDFKGYELNTGSVTYYLDTAYYMDMKGIFRYRPGDCGFTPGAILFEPFPGKEADALDYLKAHHYPLMSFDSSSLAWYSDTASDGYHDILKAMAEKYYYIEGSGEDAYFIRAVAASPFMEEQAMADLKSSGLFRLLGREAVPCGDYYSRLLLKQKYVFGKDAPSLKSGTAFFRNYITTNLNKAVIVEITPVSDFSYQVSFTGPSSYLAIKRSNMWERYRFSVTLQKGFNCKPDEMELYFSFSDAVFAMGAPSALPPEPRFRSLTDEDGHAYQEEAESYIKKFIGKMADLYEGSKLNGF